MNKKANPFSLEGRVVILTGGCGFLGKQFTEALIDAGATVVIFDRSAEEESGDRRFFMKLDITSEDEVDDAMADVHRRFGRIDSLVNNAAMNPAVGDPNSAKMSGPYEEHPVDLWRQELEVNMTGMQICTQAVAPYMMEAKRGSIVNIASEVSVIAYDWTDVYPPGKFKSAAYIATKHGVIGITRAWAAYLGKHGVRVNALSPGGVQTDKMTPEFKEAYGRKNMLGSMAKAGDYDATLVFLCSDASSRITGHNLVADGGKSSW